MRPQTHIAELLRLPKGGVFYHPDPSMRVVQRVSEYGIRSGKVFRTRRTPIGREIVRKV